MSKAAEQERLKTAAHARADSEQVARIKAETKAAEHEEARKKAE